MNIITYSEARAGFKSVMDTVCRDHEPTVVSRVNGEHVVMLSLADYNSMQETMHLLASPRNAVRLMESIQQLRAGHARSRNFDPSTTKGPADDPIQEEEQEQD
ncbi:hypothetical protein MASR2M32_01410 [Sphaerotilus sulfidivorans]|jgi:antitoxin YefM